MCEMCEEGKWPGPARAAEEPKPQKKSDCSHTGDNPYCTHPAECCCAKVAV